MNLKAANKYCDHFIVANILLWLAAGFVLGVPGDLVMFWVFFSALNVIFAFLISGGRRWIFIGFVGLGLLASRGEINAGHAWQKKQSKLRQQIMTNLFSTSITVANTNGLAQTNSIESGSPK